MQYKIINLIACQLFCFFTNLNLFYKIKLITSHPIKLVRNIKKYPFGPFYLFWWFLTFFKICRKTRKLFKIFDCKSTFKQDVINKWYLRWSPSFFFIEFKLWIFVITNICWFYHLEWSLQRFYRELKLFFVAEIFL